MTHIASGTGADGGNEGTPIEEDRLFRPGIKTTSFYCSNSVDIAHVNDLLDILLDIASRRRFVNAIEPNSLYHGERQ